MDLVSAEGELREFEARERDEIRVGFEGRVAREENDVEFLVGAKDGLKGGKTLGLESVVGEIELGDVCV